MLSATLYIIVCSGKNRLRRRLQRLREPRYLFGAFVGVAYFYFAIFGRLRLSRRAVRQRELPAAFLPALGGLGPAFAGLALLGGAVLSMGMPIGSRLLDFTRTESEFLFPSPLSRRQLLLYRLMRAQWAVLFSALIIALTYPLATPAARLRGFFGAWLLLMTCHVFFTGIALTRTRLVAPSRRALLLTWGPRIGLAAAIVVLLVSAGRTVAVEQLPLGSAGAVMTLLAQTAASGLPHLVLWPFMAVTAPLFAPSLISFLLALPAAVVVYLAVILWVLSADEAFDAVADTLMETRRQRPKPGVSYRLRPAPWLLAPSGRPETLFIWKTVTQALRIVSRRVLVRVLLIAAWITSLLVLFASRSRGITEIVAVFAALSSLFAVVFGPQIVRLDLREDLQHLELLKTWPLKAAALIRGQMMGAAALVVAVAWAFALVAMILSAASSSRAGADTRLATNLAMLIISPALILAQFTIHNTAALLFPAWVVSGVARSRGVDAMGQRIIMLGGTWIVLLLAVLPSALIGGGLWWAFSSYVGAWILVPSALIGAVVILLEVTLATEALAPVYERLDITSVERTER